MLPCSCKMSVLCSNLESALRHSRRCVQSHESFYLTLNLFSCSLIPHSLLTSTHFKMPSPSSETALRRRAGSPTREVPQDSPTVVSARNTGEKNPSLRTTDQLISDHPEIEPVHGSPSEEQEAATTTTSSSGDGASTTPSPSIGSWILSILLKPFYFLIFAILHLGHELAISVRTMKTLLQVFFLPHLFPVAPQLVRILRGDLGTDLEKKPSHLAVILPANSTSEAEEEEWHANVAQLVQWSVASGIRCLSVMRTDRKSQTKSSFVES